MSHAIRNYFFDSGVMEVSTPVRVRHNAIEPFIETLSGGAGYELQTSPELEMKWLLGAGHQGESPEAAGRSAGEGIYQIAHCFRAGERGPQHNEEFHLVEWYRRDVPLEKIQDDVEAMVALALQVAQALGWARELQLLPWERRSFLELFEQSTGVALRGDEGHAELEAPLSKLRQRAGVVADLQTKSLLGREIPEVGALASWTELFSLWSELHLDPWLAARDAGRGLHLVDFPGALAALSKRAPDQRCARRFESYWGGAELANGYDELQDAAEQRERFGWVNGLRRAQGLEEKAMPEAFLHYLEGPGLPSACGAALGLERLLRVVTQALEIWDIHVFRA